MAHGCGLESRDRQAAAGVCGPAADLAGGDCSLESLYMRGSTVCLLPRGPSAGRVNDRFLSAIDRSAEARGVRRRRLAVHDHARAVALYLAVRPARPEARGSCSRWCCCSLAKLATIAVPFTFKWATDALTGRGQRAGRAPSSWLVWVFAAPIADDHRLWRHAHPDGAADAGARRHVRQGGDARGAPARLPHLRAHAPAVAALPSRAQDRRPDARARARPQRASRPSCAW